MEKLRAGIIGSGGISAMHTNGYKRLPNVEIAACCDLNADRAKNYAAYHGIPHWYTDMNEMLAKEKLDLVSVTTWNAAHMPAAIAALNAGANVLCEKPMAMNAAEAQMMADAAKKAGKLLQVGFVRRFENSTDVIKSFSENGYIGDIYAAKVSYLRRNGCPGGWFGDKKFSGGGPLIDLGVHVIDLARYLAGNPKPVSAYGATFTNLGRDRAKNAVPTFGYERDNRAPEGCVHNVEDFALAIVRFDNGFVLNIDASFNLNIKNEDENTFKLFGTKAGIDLTNGLEIYTQLNDYFVNVAPFGIPANNFTASFNAEIEGFVKCVAENAPCKAPAEDGVILMKILDAIYESARTGHEVTID